MATLCPQPRFRDSATDQPKIPGRFSSFFRRCRCRNNEPGDKERI